MELPPPQGLFCAPPRNTARAASFVLHFLFQQGRVAQHLLARRYAELFQNVVVVKFERAFPDVKDVGDFFCGFAVQIEIKNGLFGFCKLSQSDFECFVVVRVDLSFTGICQPLDFSLSLADFGGLGFGYGCKLDILALQPVCLQI